MSDAQAPIADMRLVVRPAQEKHLWFVVDSWLKSYRSVRPGEGSEFARSIPGVVYFSDHGHRGLVLRLIAQSNTLVLGPEDDETFVHGWICFDGPTLHYVYVKEPYRGNGFAHTLLRDAGFKGAIVTSHETVAAHRWRRTGTKVDYRNPYAWREFRESQDR